MKYRERGRRSLTRRQFAVASPIDEERFRFLLLQYAGDELYKQVEQVVLQIADTVEDQVGVLEPIVRRQIAAEVIQVIRNAIANATLAGV